MLAAYVVFHRYQGGYDFLVLVFSCLLIIIGQITLKDEYDISDEIDAL